MSKEIKKIENAEIEEVTTEETTAETNGSKAKRVAKKYGKTALKVLGTVLLAVGAYALGKKAGSGSSDVETDEDDDLIYVDSDMEDDVE